MRAAADDSQAEVDAGLNANGRGIEFGDGDVGVFRFVPVNGRVFIVLAEKTAACPTFKRC
ncbi:hypothetical protein D3C76_1273160 [compost metagenome]